MTKLGITIAAVIGAPVSLGSAFGTVKWLDDRYAPLAAVEDVQWTALKKEMRELQDEIANAEKEGNTALADRLRQDLEDTTDRFCKAFPDDRICKA